MNVDLVSSPTIPTVIVTMNDKYLGLRLTLPFALILGLVVAISHQTTFAANKYWDTSATAGLQPGNGIWDTGSTALWNDVVGGTNPLTTWAANDDAFFQTGGTNVVALSGTIQANSVSFLAATDTTLNGGTLQLNSATVGINGAGASDTSNLTINSAVTVGASQAWQTSVGTVLTVNGNITGTGNTLTLSNGGSGGNRRIFFNGTNSLGALTVTGASSTARTLYLNGNTTVSGALSTSGSQTVNAQIYSGANNSFGSVTVGNGTIGLGGNNTISGTITVNGGGVLMFENDANIGGSSSALSFNAASLRILGTGMTSFGSHSLTFSSGSSLRLDIDSAANIFTVNKVVAGGTTGALSKYGKGTAVLTQANTYGSGGASGGTIVRGGVLQIDNNNGGSISSAALLNMGGGTLLLTGLNGGTTTQGTGAVTVSAYGSTIKADGGTSTATTLNLGTITATANGTTLNFVTTGSTAPTITTTGNKDATGIYGGRITYNGSDWATTSSGGSPYTLSSYSGYTALDTTAGTDTLNSRVTAGASLSGSRTTNTLKIANTGTGTLDLVAGNILTLTAGGLLFAGSADFQISNGTLQSNTATNSDLIIHQNGTGQLTIGSVIANGAGTSVLTKTGSGTLVLSGANTYTGATYINGGVLSVGVIAGTNNNLGNLSTQGLFLNNGTLQYTGATATTTKAVTLGTMGGTINVTSGATSLTLSGIVGDDTSAPDSRPGSLTKKGAGTLILSGSNSFVGGVFLEDGVLQVGVAGALNSTNPSAVTFSSGSTGTLRLNGFSTTVSGLSTNPIPGTTFVENNHASTATTLTVNSTFASSYSGVIRNGAAATLSLIKTGGNSLTLGGTNTYTGTTTVSAGTLIINGSTASGSAFTVAGGSTLAGSGTIGGTVTLNSGSTLSPGNSPGILSTGAQTWLDGGNYNWQLLNATAAAGTGYDTVAITGGLNLSNLTGSPDFNINLWTLSSIGPDVNGNALNFNSASTYSWKLVSTTTGITGFNAANFTINTSATNGTSGFSNSFTGTFNVSVTGNDLYLNYTAVPEPTTWALLAFSLTTVMVLRRRSSWFRIQN